jgi:hypothetical protein
MNGNIHGLLGQCCLAGKIVQLPCLPEDDQDPGGHRPVDPEHAHGGHDPVNTGAHQGGSSLLCLRTKEL